MFTTRLNLVRTCFSIITSIFFCKTTATEPVSPKLGTMHYIFSIPIIGTGIIEYLLLCFIESLSFYSIIKFVVAWRKQRNQTGKHNGPTIFH